MREQITTFDIYLTFKPEGKKSSDSTSLHKYTTFEVDRRDVYYWDVWAGQYSWLPEFTAFSHFINDFQLFWAVLCHSLLIQHEYGE